MVDKDFGSKGNKKTNLENYKLKNLLHKFMDYIESSVQLNPGILL